MQDRNKQQNFDSDDNTKSPIKGQGVTAPGNNWVNQGKGVTLKYWVNTVTNSVRIWQVAISNTPGVFSTYSCDSVYRAGELFKNVTVDENDKQVIEFKDREGKVLLKRYS